MAGSGGPAGSPNFSKVTGAPSPEQYQQMGAQAVAVVRAAMITTAVAAIILGIIALFWPGATLVVVAVLFGIWLVISGVMRMAMAFTAGGALGGSRALTGVLGLLIAIAGVICLAHPGSALWVLAVVIGVGWIIDGIVTLFSGNTQGTVGPRWLSVVGGIISVIAGIIVLALPGLAIATFALFGGILLIIVGIMTLTTLPPSASDG